MRELRNTYNILVIKPKAGDILGDLGGDDDIKMDPKNRLKSQGVFISLMVGPNGRLFLNMVMIL
jgi:hypothetical protein